MDKLAYSPKELSKALSLSTHTLAKDRKVGHIGIPFVKLGNRIVYPVTKVQEWLENSSKSPEQYQAKIISINNTEVKRSKGRPKGTTKVELAKRAGRNKINA